MRFAIVRALFNAEITSGLLDGALRGFADARVSKRDVAVYEVPGSFELPVAALWLAKSGRFDAVVCLGCVIRGETAHFEYVASEAARGIAGVALQTGVPTIFGVLTTETVDQARDRSAEVDADIAAAEIARPLVASTPDHTGPPRLANKGYEAAASAIQMATLARKIRKR